MLALQLEHTRHGQVSKLDLLDETLMDVAQVPAGVVSAAPEARMKPGLEATGLEHVFQTVVSGDDVYRGRPDPEAYLYAAQQLGRPSVRCVVIGNSNQVCFQSCFVVQPPTAAAVNHIDWRVALPKPQTAQLHALRPTSVQVVSVFCSMGTAAHVRVWPQLFPSPSTG